MEYGKDKIIITADCVRELIEFAMDIQDELSRKSQKLEMLERYYGNTTYIPDEVSVILDINEKPKPKTMTDAYFERIIKRDEHSDDAPY